MPGVVGKRHWLMSLNCETDMTYSYFSPKIARLESKKSSDLQHSQRSCTKSCHQAGGQLVRNIAKHHPIFLLVNEYTASNRALPLSILVPVTRNINMTCFSVSDASPLGPSKRKPPSVCGFNSSWCVIQGGFKTNPSKTAKHKLLVSTS